MLAAGDSTVLGRAGDVAAPAAAIGAYEVRGGGGVRGTGEFGSNSGEDEKVKGDEGDRSFGGNRWPRQETLALLKIRSNMDQVFRDSSLKGPLWEEVSRKLAELGYHRSAKKCKEKFENVYKYHKRTKEGRTGKPEGKHYKFFDQLEAFDHQNHHHSSSVPPSKPNQTPMQAPTTMPWTNMNIVSSSTSHINVSNNTQNTVTTPIPPPPPPTNPTIVSTAPSSTTRAMNSYPNSVPASFQSISTNLFSSSTSSSTASDEESEGLGKRKRKWKEFFKRLTKDVMKKQEELQDKFLKAIEKREHERVVREESWRIQEMARINREHEILIQERSTAAAKDAAVISFLQKISGGQQQNPVQTRENNPQPPPPPPTTAINFGAITTVKPANLESGVMSTSSRWPKAEVEALIKFRTELALKYQENGPKGPLWEEISAAMRSIGYNRSAKRCKEKWENINKYFKKVRESNRKRSEDSKTCPYYDQLDALYKEKSKTDIHKPPMNPMVPLMVQPEQQWPLQPHTVIEEIERDNNNADQIQDDEEEDEDGETEDDEYEGGGYEMVANKQQPASMGTAE